MGLPIFTADDVIGFSGAIDRLGCAIVRNALPVPFLASYADGIARCHDYLEGVVEAGLERLGAREPATSQTLEAKRRQSGFSLSFRLNYELQMPAHVQQIFQVIRDSPLLGLAGSVFGRRAAILTDNCSARLQRPREPDRGLALHQDVVAAGITAPQQQGLTFWIPLNALDGRAPTLEVLPLRFREILPHRYDERAYAVLESQDEWREAIGASLQPVDDMRPGDVLVFTSYTIHGTRIGPDVDRSRYSLDIRCRPLDEVAASYGGTLMF